MKVSDDKCAPVTYQSGDTNGDNKLQTTETWTFTCSMPITVATTNVAVASGKDKNGLEVTAQDSFTVAVVSPVVAKKICPIDVTLHKPQPKKVGNKILTNKIKTKKSSCVLLKPVVLCRPLASTAAGETAFCDTKVTKKGRITVKTKGYDAVRVTRHRAHQAQARLRRPLEAQHLAQVLDPEVTQEPDQGARTHPVRALLCLPEHP